MLASCGGRAPATPATPATPTAPATPAAAAPVEPAPNQCQEPLVARTVEYQAFDDKRYQRQAWIGERIALLVPAGERDECVMTHLVSVLDQAYTYYQKVTGQEPKSNKSLEGRPTIAVVEQTCGAGCGYLGASGIELMPDFFEVLYRGVAESGRFDQVVFYELGRNFWFYSDQIEFTGTDNTGSVTTGYAVLMRFMSMKAVSAKGGPFNGRPFKEFRREVEDLLDRYLADPNANFDNTLRVGKAPANPMNLGATDLFASIIFRLARVHGDGLIERLWREVGKRPKATSTEQAIDNLVLAASAAARVNLGRVFGKRWRFPISTQAYSELLQRFGPAVSPASY